MKGGEQRGGPAGPQLGLISLEEEGFFLLGGHGTQKFHLIGAENRESGVGRDLTRGRYFSKTFKDPRALLS